MSLPLWLIVDGWLRIDAAGSVVTSKAQLLDAEEAEGNGGDSHTTGLHPQLGKQDEYLAKEQLVQAQRPY